MAVNNQMVRRQTGFFSTRLFYEGTSGPIHIYITDGCFFKSSTIEDPYDILRGSESFITDVISAVLELAQKDNMSLCVKDAHPRGDNINSWYELKVQDIGTMVKKYSSKCQKNEYATYVSIQIQGRLLV